MAPSSPPILHGYTSRCTPKLSPSYVEPDLEIIDLENSKPTPKNSQLSRTRLIQTGSESIPNPLRLRSAEADLEELAQKVESLENCLLKDAQPKLQKALEVVELEKRRVEDLRHALASVNRSLSETDTSENLQGLSKSQLCEVRQLARNPPEHVRSMLLAIWLILNCDRFRGKGVVHLSEGRDWPLCQKMLADRRFVSRLHAFDLTSLDEVPHVLTHIARTFFGIENATTPEDTHTEIELHRSASEGAIFHSASRTLPSLHSGALSKAVHEGRPRLHNSSNSMQSTRLTKSMSACSLPHLPLDQQEVQRASETCGALYRWLRTLVLDRARRVWIQQDLVHAEKHLACTERACREADIEVAELRGDLESNRKYHAQQEQFVSDLSFDLEMSRQHQLVHEQSLKNLRQDLMSSLSKTCADINGVLDRSVPVRMRPRSRCKVTRPPCDITFKTTTLENGTWRESFERYNAPGSPSWSRRCMK